MKRINFLVEDSLFDTFKNHVIKERDTMSRILNNFLIKYIEEIKKENV